MPLWLTLNRYMAPETILTIAAQYTEISLNFLVWRFCGIDNFRRVLDELNEFLRFHEITKTRKVDEISVFYGVNNHHTTISFFSQFLIKDIMSSFDKKNV